MPARKKVRGLGLKDVQALLGDVFGGELHAKRVLSLSNGVTGVIHASAASIHAIGRGLASAEGLDPRHSVKQVDRLLSNPHIDPWELFADWVPFVLAERDDAVVAMDWTEFDDDDHATIAIHLITSHGRATPLVWKTVEKSGLEGNRNRYEDEVLGRLIECAPPREQVRITVLADRGFGDQKLYEGLERSGIKYAIRFRQHIIVEDETGAAQPAQDWLYGNGRARSIRNAKVTRDRTSVPHVVVVKKQAMKDAWFLASNRDDLTASEVVKLYGRRFTIEESFRDTKNLRFGLGVSATHIRAASRRDRLLFLTAIAQVLLTLLGAAAERTGLDRKLQTNTSKRRQYSLFFQGCYWYSAIPAMKEERLRLLMTAFGEIVSEQRVFRKAFGIV